MHAAYLGPGRLPGRRRARRVAHRPRDRRATSTGASSGRARALAAEPPLLRPPTSCSASPRPTCASRSTCARCSRASSTARASRSSSRCTARRWCTGWARCAAFPVGIVANNGILFSEESKKGAQFIQLCNQRDTPIAVRAERHRLHGRHALRAGRDHQGRRQADQRGFELDRAAPDPDGRRQLRRGQLRHVRARVRSALRVQLAEPPHRGDGRQAAGRGPVDRPTQRRRTRRPRRSTRAADAAARASVEDQIERESTALFASGQLWDDGIIDPRETRIVLGMALSAAHSAPVRGTSSFGVFRM